MKNGKWEILSHFPPISESNHLKFNVKSHRYLDKNGQSFEVIAHQIIFQPWRGFHPFIDMASATRLRPIFEDPNAKVWTTEEDIYLMENQEQPLEDQAVKLGCTVDEISDRRAVLGLIQRARAIIRLAQS